VLIGSREDVNHLGYAIGVCPKCGREGAFTVTIAKRKLTLYIVAAIPMNQQMVLECGNCHVRFAIPKAEQEEMRGRLISAEELNARMLGHRNGQQVAGAPPPAALAGPTLYQQLQLDPSAEPDVIEAAYKRLAFRYHPDRDRSPEAVQRMQVINEARRVLADPELREQYDRSIGLSRKPTPPPRPPQPRPPAPHPDPAPEPAPSRPEPPGPAAPNPPGAAPTPSPVPGKAIRADEV
jgi:hypothetical protein